MNKEELRKKVHLDIEEVMQDMENDGWQFDLHIGEKPFYVELCARIIELRSQVSEEDTEKEIKEAFKAGRTWNNSWNSESYYKELSSLFTKHLKEKP